MASAKDAEATPAVSEPTPADDTKLKSAAPEAKADDKLESKEAVAVAAAGTAAPVSVDDAKVESSDSDKR